MCECHLSNRVNFQNFVYCQLLQNLVSFYVEHFIQLFFILFYLFILFILFFLFCVCVVLLNYLIWPCSHLPCISVIAVFCFCRCFFLHSIFYRTISHYLLNFKKNIIE